MSTLQKRNIGRRATDHSSSALPQKKRGFFRALFGFFAGMFYLIVATTLFFGLLMWASYALIGFYIRGQEIPAPDLRGKSLISALDEMKKWNLTLTKDHEEPSDNVDDGEIISQDPPAGAIIKKRSPIRVVVSSGRRHFPIPAEVLTMSSRETAIRLGEMGLKVGNIAFIWVPGQPNDRVLATDPPIGVGAPPGSAVNLLVNSESPDQQLLAPNLSGMTVDTARDELGRLGLSLSTIRESDEAGVGPGLIHSQIPPAGAPITTGGAVEVVVAPAG